MDPDTGIAGPGVSVTHHLWSVSSCRGRWQHLLADAAMSLLLVMGHGAVIMCQVGAVSCCARAVHNQSWNTGVTP